VSDGLSDRESDGHLICMQIGQRIGCKNVRVDGPLDMESAPVKRTSKCTYNKKLKDGHSKCKCCRSLKIVTNLGLHYIPVHAEDSPLLKIIIGLVNLWNSSSPWSRHIFCRVLCFERERESEREREREREREGEREIDRERGGEGGESERERKRER
jgi:hypothetical protein